MALIRPETVEPTETVLTGLIVPEASTTCVIVRRFIVAVSYTTRFLLTAEAAINKSIIIPNRAAMYLFFIFLSFIHYPFYFFVSFVLF